MGEEAACLDCMSFNMSPSLFCGNHLGFFFDVSLTAASLFCFLSCA
uniref:Uncharacterized protein n=1 Tax=Manihot esculenta TaxID=3983 RepID=A0A2C9UBN1_MANES